MSTLKPISEFGLLSECERYLEANFNKGYLLVWMIGIDTGLRVSDVLNLKYSNFKSNAIELCESKGRLHQLARIKNKVLATYLDDVVDHYRFDDDNYRRVRKLKPHQLYGKQFSANGKAKYDAIDTFHKLVPNKFHAEILENISFEQSRTRKTLKVVNVDLDIIRLISNRKKTFIANKNDFIFDGSTFSSNRAVYGKPITRQSCYKVFSTLTAHLEGLGYILNVGCHTARKTFARSALDAGKSITHVMEILGHSHPKITMRYVGLEQESLEEARVRAREYRKGVSTL